MPKTLTWEISMIECLKVPQTFQNIFWTHFGQFPLFKISNFFKMAAICNYTVKNVQKGSAKVPQMWLEVLPKCLKLPQILSQLAPNVSKCPKNSPGRIMPKSRESLKASTAESTAVATWTILMELGSDLSCLRFQTYLQRITVGPGQDFLKNHGQFTRSNQYC